MDVKSCAHKDVRQIDNLRCCMSCGETLYLQQQPRTSSQPKTSLPSEQHGTHHGLSHTYGDLRLSNGHAIRVLVLLPGDFHDPIFCTIATTDLDKAQYDAVSYTWATEDGDDMKSGRIHLPDGVIAVTENCEAALRQLRLRSAPRQLWIDAVCIDQANTQERNHQVGQMDHIYRSAATVHICISVPNRRYTECMRWLNSEAGLIFWSKTKDISTVITQLNDLFQRRYFSRVWVIQELYLAREIVLHVNSDRILHFGNMLDKLDKRLDVPQVLQDIRGTSRVKGVKECLRLSLPACSSDPRDKVFAILSLIGPHFRKYLPVDYTMEYSQILGLAVMLSISESRSLRLLRFAQLPVTSDSTTASSFGMHEFLNFLRNGQLDWDWEWQSNQFFERPKPVIVKMMLTETNTQEYVNCSLPVVPGDIYTIVEQTSQWYPTQQILPRIKVHASMIDISLGPLEDEDVSLPSIVARQADGKFTQYAWLQHIFQRPRVGSRVASAQHELSSYFNWEDFTRCISEMDKFNQEDVTTRTSGTKDSSTSTISFPQHTLGSSTFRTHYSVGYSLSSHIIGDHVFAIDGIPEHFLLRPIGSNVFRIVGRCYLWAAQSLDYWNPGTYKGLWREKPVDLGVRSRTIEIY